MGRDRINSSSNDVIFLDIILLIILSLPSLQDRGVSDPFDSSEALDKLGIAYNGSLAYKFSSFSDSTCMLVAYSSRLSLNGKVERTSKSSSPSLSSSPLGSCDPVTKSSGSSSVL